MPGAGFEAARLNARYPAAHAAITAELDNLRATADWCVDCERWVELIGMAHGMSIFLIDSAAIDRTEWYRQAIDHPATLDTQTSWRPRVSWRDDRDQPGGLPKCLRLGRTDRHPSTERRSEEFSYASIP